MVVIYSSQFQNWNKIKSYWEMNKNKQKYMSRGIANRDKIVIILNEKEWLIYFNINNNLITTNSKRIVII